MRKVTPFIAVSLMTTFGVTLALALTPTQSIRSLTTTQISNSQSTETTLIESSGPNDGQIRPRLCQPITIEQGEISHYGYDREGFDGATLTITTPEAWTAFWRLHKGEDCPLPRIDFTRNVVIAAIQGPQTSGGGPNIAIMNVTDTYPIKTVNIFDDRRPGLLDVITNPYHIVQVPKRVLSPNDAVAINRVRPIPDSGVVVGKVFAITPDGERKPLPFSVVTLLLPAPTDETSKEEAAPMPIRVRTGLDGSFHIPNVPSIRSIPIIAEHRGFTPQKELIGMPPNVLVVQDFVLEPLPIDEEADTESVTEQTPVLEVSPS